jgi:mannan endo-1,4-beta-mannosidase
MKKLFVIIILVIVPFLSHSQNFELIDENASPKTEVLFHKLKKIQDEGKVLFGHQEATTYGRTWYGDENRSDVKDITGSHPAVIGLDFADVTTANTEQFLKEKAKLVKSVVDTYNRGGISTFAWHQKNPANGGSFYWEQNPVKVVSDMLPNGKLHEAYKFYLKTVADVAYSFRNEKGELIPVIFRPYHEYDGEWFWWGKGHCTKEEFIDLWQFTVEYLKDELGVRNFIYAFSPDCRFDTEKEFLDYYPGDEYVDMLGMDNYWDFRSDGNNNPALAEKKLRIVADVAQKRNKLAAFTETGLEGVPQSDWFTATLLPILEKVKVCYVLVWRNAHDNPTHHYAPDKGHTAESDFKKFTETKTILLENDLPDMYK